jgi:diguanylate cyclase (GGDEF)-like protein
LRLFAFIAGLNMRATDVLGRMGGEEFVAILPGAAIEAAVAAERVRLAFEAAAVTVADQAVGATVSIGIASGEPGADTIAMIAAADRALYMAKMNGRNRVELTDERPSAAPRDERLDPLSETTSGPIPTPALAS